MTQRRPPTPHATRPRGAGSGAPGQSQGQAAVGQEQGCEAVHRLHATRQRRFPPVAAWASSRSGLSKLLSPTLRSSAQSVATFSLVSSPNPKLPRPGFHTGQRVSQAGVHGLWLRPSVLPSLCPVCRRRLSALFSKPLKLPPVLADLSAGEGPFQDSGISLLLQIPQEHQAHFTFSPFFSFFFLSSFLVHRDLSCPLRFPRSSANSLNNDSVCICILDSFGGR